MATTPQQFCLRWNNHQSNIVSVFEQLLHSEAFVDVTLAVEGMSIKAHKVVLSACSPYFQAVLASHPDKHPIIILKDVRYVDMRDLLDFMYRGEVSVDQDNLSGFLRVAESLRIKGLTEVNEKKRLDTPTSPYVVSQSLLGSPTQGVISTTSVLPNDMNPLKRPPLSPTGSFSSSKRRRGRPPKISGDESEGDASSGGLTSSVEKVESRLEGEAQAVKVEPEEFGKDEAQEDKKSVDGRVSESASSSSWDGQTKDDLHPPKEEPDHTRYSRDSPGSGGVQNSHTWTPSDYEQEELNNHHGQSSSSSPLKLDLMSHSTSLLQLPPKSVAHTQHLPPSVTDIDQLYYTKNLLEAAMLKNPYDALKNDKHLHGSILLASLRSPLKFGLQGMYGDRIIGERDLIDSSSVSPHRLPSPPKSNQSSQNSISPSRVSANNGNSKKDCNSNGNSTNSNGKGVSVPIMSYCIQDNGFKCSKCFQTFTHPSNFHRHYITVHTDRRAHKCHVCGKEFKRKDNMMSHIRSVHRPGKEGHSIFRDLSTLSPTLSRNASPLPLPLPEQLVQPVDKV